jgi:C4-dicarboxylate-specific signal transduction histidine kinase
MALENTGSKNFFSLQRKLLIGVLSISAAVTTVLTAISFYVDYREEKQALGQMLSQIEISTLPGLANAMWDFDESKIEAQLMGVYALPDIVSVELMDSKSKVIAEKKLKEGERVDIVQSYVVWYSQTSDQVEQIGTLNVSATESHLFARIFNRMMIFFLTQLLKTTVASSLIFVFINSTVTRRLRSLSQRMKKGTTIEYRNSRFLSSYDEVNELMDSFEKLDSENKKLIESQKEEIKVQQASAIESARLASLGEMASGIAHEINNPLAIVQGSVTLLKMNIDKPFDRETHLKQYDRIEKMVFRAKGIIDSMKLSARDGSQDPLEWVSIRQILEDATILSETRMTKLGIEFRVQLSDFADTVVSVRRSQLSQVMVNLLNNSIDAISKMNEKWIEFSAFIKDQMVFIQITDCGNGVPQATQEKLFRPFFTTKEVGKGTGLGLSLSRKICQEFKGNLELDSTHKNTRFIVKLPWSAENQSRKKLAA